MISYFSTNTILSYSIVVDCRESSSKIFSCAVRFNLQELSSISTYPRHDQSIKKRKRRWQASFPTLDQKFKTTACWRQIYTQEACRRLNVQLEKATIEDG